jgi:membrane associated rhomboid family serine protease
VGAQCECAHQARRQERTWATPQRAHARDGRLCSPQRAQGRRIAEGQWWRLVTALYLHAGVIHAVVNMAILLRLVPRCGDGGPSLTAARPQGWWLESGFGSVAFVGVYAASGVFGELVGCGASHGVLEWRGSPHAARLHAAARCSSRK